MYILHICISNMYSQVVKLYLSDKKIVFREMLKRSNYIPRPPYPKSFIKSCYVNVLEKRPHIQLIHCTISNYEYTYV